MCRTDNKEHAIVLASQVRIVLARGVEGKAAVVEDAEAAAGPGARGAGAAGLGEVAAEFISIAGGCRAGIQEDQRLQRVRLRERAGDVDLEVVLPELGGLDGCLPDLPLGLLRARKDLLNVVINCNSRDSGSYRTTANTWIRGLAGLIAESPNLLE